MVPKEQIKAEVLAFLRSQKTAVLATTSGKEPHVATVFFTVGEDFTFYIVSHLGSKKVQDIRLNENVALVAGFGPAPVTAQMGGKAEIIEDYRTDTLFRKTVMLELLEKIEIDLKQWPIMKVGEGELVVLKITPTWMSWLNLDKEGRPLSYAEDFYKIIP